MSSHAAISRNRNKDNIEVSGSVYYNVITFAETLASKKEEMKFLNLSSQQRAKRLSHLMKLNTRMF